MDVYIISILITGLTVLAYLVVIVIMLINWHSSRTNSWYIIFLISGLFWMVVGFIRAILDDNLDYDSLLVKIDFSLAAIIAYSVSMFAIHFPRRNEKITILTEVTSFLPIVVIIIMIFGNFLFVDTDEGRGLNNTQYLIYFITILVYFVIIPYTVFIKKRRNAGSIVRLQIKYLLLGYSITISVMLGASFYSALISEISNSTFAMIQGVTIFFAISSLYVLLRYRFLDIRVVLKKGAVYLASLLFMTGIYVYAVTIFRDAIEEAWNASVGWTAAMLIVISAIGFVFVKNGTEFAINNIFKGNKSIDLAVAEVKAGISEVKDLLDLKKIITRSTNRYLGVQSSYLLLRNEGGKFNSENSIRLDPGKSNLLLYLDKHREPIVVDEIQYMIDELENESEKNILQKIEKEMKKLKTNVVIPFTNDDGVFGILLVGERNRGEPYTVQDVQFLEKIREQVSFVLASAIQYSYAMKRITNDERG